MNLYMTNQINFLVGENDILYHLGDFAFGGGKQVHEYINHINCKNIILILGNHDMRFKKLYTARFKEVRKELTTRLNNVQIAMNHYPVTGLKCPHEIYLHGHTHCYQGVKSPAGQIDISVEGNNFKPYHISEIIALAKS